MVLDAKLANHLAYKARRYAASPLCRRRRSRSARAGPWWNTRHTLGAGSGTAGKENAGALRAGVGDLEEEEEEERISSPPPPGRLARLHIRRCTRD